ncbi:MAG: two-component regulator propeller domain-containing protein, partial [Acidobacteriota bacterium]
SHDPDDPESLSIDEVMRILESRDGMLWFGTRGGGLNRFDPLQERFTRYGNADDEPGPLATDTIGCLLEDSSDHIWVGTGDALHRLDPRSGSWRSWRHDPNDPDSLGAGGVQALAEDAAGRLWIGTGESGLHSLQLAEADTTGALVQYRHDPDDPYSLSSDEIFSLAIDKAGMLWVGTNGAVDRFDPTAQSCERLPLDPTDPSRQNSFVSALYEDGSGDLWIASHGAGLSHLDQATRTFTHYRHDANDPYGLKSDDLLDLHQDSTGILWITSRDGIDKFDRRREQFLTFRPNAQAPNGLRGDQIWAVVEDHAGVVWIGAFDGGLSGFDRTTGSVTHFTRADGGPTSLPNISITSVVEDSEGALWIGTRGGLSRLDRDRQRFVHYRHDPQDAGSLPENFIYSLLVDRTDTVWIGHGDQVSRFDRDTESFTAYRHDPADGGSLSSEEVYGVFEDRTGDLWVATFGGLNRLDAEGSFTHIRHDPADRNSLSSDQVTWLHHATSGIYWIATIGGGLSRWDRERGEFRHFREKDGLSDDSVVGILEDDAGHLWIAASNGLNRFDPITEQFTTFGVEDGLHGDIFYIGPAFRSTSGEMFLGGVGGLSAFFPDQIRGDPSPPKVVLTDFRLLNLPVPLRHRDPDSPLAESITATRELTLDYRDKVFSVEFAALHYASPKDNRYTYRLAGFDDDWIATRADQRFAQYTNLDPGPYELQVKASNKDGVWSETPVTLQLRVLPPPWKTWWAYSLYSLALASIVVGYLHWQRVKLARERALNTRLREVDRLKDEFLANTSHELRTPLYGIVGIAESLLDGAAGPVGEAMRSNLGMIVNSGRRLSGLVNDILDFSKMSRRGLELQKKAVDLKALTDVVLTLSKPLLGDKDLQLLNTIDPGLPAAEGDENRLQQILLNLLSNAIKFTESGRVEVSAVAEEGRLTVRVLDTGIGISQDHQEHIFESFEQADASTERQFGGTGLGLAVTKELVALHGGSVWVESVPGEGSSFFFTLPIAEGSAPSSPTESIVDTGVLAGIEAAVPGAAAEPPPDDGARDDRHRILIVDDEPVIRQVLVNHLTASELSTRQATGGAAALRLLEREHFDLVLLDVMMPRMSGYEVCRRIRRHH